MTQPNYNVFYLERGERLKFRCFAADTIDATQQAEKALPHGYDFVAREMDLWEKLGLTEKPRPAAMLRITCLGNDFHVYQTARKRPRRYLGKFPSMEEAQSVVLTLRMAHGAN